MKSLLCSLAATLLLLGSTAPSDAARIIYFDENGGGANPRGLYDFDTATGISTLRCPVGGSERFWAMDRRRSDNAVFGVDLWGGGLWTIDVNSGVTSLVGTMTPPIDRPEGIAFHPQTGEMFVASISGALYQVDPGTATSSFVGACGRSLRGHCFSADGAILFAFEQGSGQAYGVNPVSGSATLLSEGIPSNAPEDSTLTPEGSFFGTDFDGHLYALDATTGLATHSWSTGMGSGLLALVAIPEPSTILLLSTGAVGLLVYAWRRKRTTN